jgi:hypothetical protein
LRGGGERERERKEGRKEERKRKEGRKKERKEGKKKEGRRKRKKEKERLDYKIGTLEGYLSGRRMNTDEGEGIWLMGFIYVNEVE